MKRIYFLLLLILPFCVVAQTNYSLNQKDSLGKKQGYWIYYGKDRPEAGIPSEGIIEEGGYINDRKEGPWIKYYSDGQTIKLIGNYQNNRPGGTYKKYYENGVLKERGIFEKNTYKDTLFRFANTGDTTEIIVYDQQGKLVDTVCFSPIKNESIVCTYPSTKTITIKKFKPNGKNKVYTEKKEIWQEGTFRDGKLWDGKVYVYDRDGVLLQVKIYKKGVFVSNGRL